MRLPRTLAAWGGADFSAVAKAEIEALDPALLPLQEGLSQSSHALTDKVSAIVLNTEVADGRLRLKVGLFYAGIIAGCSCADDPSPVDEITEYCEVWIWINPATADAVAGLV
jgi:hypothetical protein